MHSTFITFEGGQNQFNCCPKLHSGFQYFGRPFPRGSNSHTGLRSLKLKLAILERHLMRNHGCCVVLLVAQEIAYIFSTNLCGMYKGINPRHVITFLNWHFLGWPPCFNTSKYHIVGPTIHTKSNYTTMKRDNHSFNPNSWWSNHLPSPTIIHHS